MKRKSNLPLIKLKLDNVNMSYYSIKRNSLLFLYAFLFTIGCTTNSTKKEQPINEIQIVPVPDKILYKRGFFELTKETRVLLNLSDNSEKEIANILLDQIKEKIGHKLKISDAFTTKKIENRIEIIHNPELGEEAYNLLVSRTIIKLEYSSIRGASYGINTLTGLLIRQNNQWLIPQISIEDKPFNAFRAIYLTKDITLDEKLIIQLAQHRFNYLVIPDNARDTIKNELIRVMHNQDLKKSEFKLLTGISPSVFYNTNVAPDEKIAFEPDSVSLLSTDSLIILEEALWSKPQSKNIKKLKERLAD
ncbi:MAG: hypothetical protein KDC79_11715 [Cyclobacteriaceae bacterium]|nr:hypothetical protein [Cyclobacteriaceae bacterium]